MTEIIDKRIKTLNSVLLNKKDQEAVKKEFTAAKGDWAKASARLKNKLPEETFQRASFAHSLADWSNDHVKIVKALSEEPDLVSMRDVALRYNSDKLAAMVDTKDVPETIAGATSAEKKRNFAAALHRELFLKEPSAVLQRMVQDNEIPIVDASVRTGVGRILNNLPDFNIRTTSVYKAFKRPEAFEGIADEQRAGVMKQLKHLSLVGAISPVPEAVPVLIKANLTSGFKVAEMTESSFQKTYGKELGEEIARQVYTNAVNSRIRNEHALMTMHEVVRGTGLAAIDGKKTMKVRMAESKEIVAGQEVQIDLETLFGSMDFCECGECNSVYSPAAYFVELLQFLRNNNLDPNTQKYPNTGQEGIVGTPLEKMFRRRPDLGCLELTCQNTNTVLPYVDLVNEVMESFVVHLGEYRADTNDPKQAKLEHFNVIEETSSELLAQPQHINYDAYCILKNEVYPFTLPYHQPTDAIRIFLKYLGTSRYELLKRFRSANQKCGNLSSTEQEELNALYKVVLDRSVDAEFLGLTQEEYIILTKEAFWPKQYFDITQKKTYTDDEYRQNIGVKPVNKYYGYDSEEEMLSIDESLPPIGQKGLTFVKKQFLPRTGIQYVDLVELLKTRFINPNYPQGKALTLMESLRFSYRFLQTLVNTSSTDPKIRFTKVIEFLEKTQFWLPLLDAMLHPDPCQQQKTDYCIKSLDLRHWVYCNFEKVGQVIVLESGEGMQLPIEGEIWLSKTSTPDTGSEEPNFVYNLNEEENERVGTLRKDGTIVDNTGAIIGRLTLTIGTYKSDNNEVVDKEGARIGRVRRSDRNRLKDNEIVPVASPVNWEDELKFKDKWLSIMNGDQEIGTIHDNELIDYQYESEYIFLWLPAKDTCNLDKVRLAHLDGTVVNIEEYDRMQRFIRLWRKMGWTIDETDKALIGLSASLDENGGGTPTKPGECDYVGFNTFTEDCSRTNDFGGGCDDDGRDDLDCPDVPHVLDKIAPDFLHQLVAVRKLLDTTGLPLVKLLAFWTDISTSGEKSLYSNLFLTHNLLGIDKVFKADKNGNYLTQSAKLTEHIPVLMAALKLKADDIAAIISFRKLPDELTLRNVSVLYRHGMLAKILHAKILDLPDIFVLFGDPFVSAYETLKLFKTWGKMEDAGFTFRQLNYLIQNHDDAVRPLAPSKKTILTITKTLYDGLNAIDRDHSDIQDDKKYDATADLVRTKAGLIFEQQVVEQIIGLLEGTTVYTTNAPANQNITIPDSLVKKLKYSDQKDANPPSAMIQVTGILTETEKSEAKALCTHLDWSKAIERVSKQPQNILNDTLFGIFSDVNEAKAKLLTGDIFPPDGNTTLDKRFYFLQHLLPFLRQRLTRRFLVDTMSGAAGVARDVTEVLLSEILVVSNPPQSAISALENIKKKPTESTGGWKGHLIPSAEGMFTFVAIGDTKPAPISIDGQSIPFPNQQEDPSNVWSTDPTPLKAGTLYWLELTDRTADQLQWKTSGSPKATIPSSALLPDYSAKGTEEVFTKLYKTALLVNGFTLSSKEVSYWQTHAADFDAFDFNAVKLKHWQRLQAYTDLRDNLPELDTTLLDVFKWSNKPDNPAKLSEKISAVTGWKDERIKKLLTADHFDLNPEDFRNEVNIVKLKKTLAVADKIDVDINRLFEWAKPGSKFWECHKIAEDIRKAVRARYDMEDWEQVVKPLNDQLRESQKQALISHLLVQKELIDWGVVDADSLFEFFLIDVQMGACMETSRIKQAISSVQLFIQRCLMGLEENYGVPNNALDRDRWEWMQKYRVWEANRKVFLYPENWIEPQLRDDKSPFYKELESELLQKDINTQTVQDALKSYLFKVDEVGNLQVVGLFYEQDIDNDTNPIDSKLHVFARTRNAPYFFYYRYFDTKEKNWYPWEKVQVDIPCYDLEDSNGNITKNGTYLIPVVWNKRLLIFFPQFMKKTKAQGSGNISIPAKPAGTSNNVQVQTPLVFWEIKMAWSEYRNRKWTQKQVSAEAVYESAVTVTTTLPGVNSYEFIPRIVTTEPEVVIDIYRETDAFGAFHFAGSQLSKDNALVLVKSPPFNNDFHYTNGTPPQIHSLQATGTADPSLLNTEPYFEVPKTSVKIHNDGVLNFYHPFAHELLGKLISGDLDDVFTYYRNTVFAKYYNNEKDAKEDAFGSDTKAIYHELKRSYSIYNWEAGFHAPMLLVDRLLKSQQFDQALKMCHYIFNPLADGTDEKRFWQFTPFKEIDAKNVLEQLFMGLQPNTSDTPDGQINEWRDNPFQPHVVARSRPSAYMKWVVMKYIDILIAYGDYYFRQNTLETIPMAIQCYVLAAHIYGPRGQKIPKRGKIQPQTYNSLLDKWDAFSNAMVEMELAFPFSNQTPLPFGVSNGVVGLANVFGFATSLYFCIPDNPNLRNLRDTIDDRLFKIRHCEDIEGVFRKLPLFEPPIEPGLLVQAVAQGLSLSSVLNDMNSPMPNYRFYYLLQKALELCSELKSLGNTFLSTKEKGDAEALSQLRARHESSIHNLVMEVRKQQLDESQKSLEALQQSRKGPEYRLQHYLKLIGEDLGKVPDGNTDFGELPNQIEQPIDESGLKLIYYEKEEMDKASDARDWQTGIGIAETLASILNIIPNFSGNIQPWGIGLSISFGGSNLGSAAQAVARGLQIHSSDLSYQSTNAGRKGGFLRQLQDRVQQANVAGYEIKNIDKQILTQQIHINIANQEITNQQKQIDNAQEVEEYLRNKYTNEELYSWMEGSIRTLYYQAYTLAYDLAKRTEKVYRFERGLTTSNFIQFGYWDAGHDGLLAGERMYIGLKQLEAAYQEKRGYDFEVTKHVSLRQVNPLAFILLKETGTCEFALPEVLFDMDHPGHYMRRIKSIALTIPCVVGPYTSLNCTLRLLEHKFRTNAIAKDKNDYPEKTDETDDRFSTVNVPITSIAVSTGQNDSGVFELNFKDERYIPFEGAGAISKWRIELPADFRQFDYDTISDVILHMRYTTVDGGDKLEVPAAASVQDYIKGVEELSQQEGLFAAFDLKYDFPDEWYKATNPQAGATERLLKLSNLYERLPIFTRGRLPPKILATDMYLFSSAALAASTLVLTQGADEFTFTDAPPVGTMKSFVTKDNTVPMDNWQLKIKDIKTELDKLWLIVRYKI